MYFGFELMAGGSVADIMKSRFPSGIKDICVIATILRDCLLGIDYLHQNKLFHRDVKASNILLSDKGRVALSDFTLSSKIKKGKKNETFTGSPCWMAPEILEGAEGYDKSVDIWYSYYSCRALGITCIEMAEGSAPHSSENSMQAMIKIINQDPPKLKEEPWNEVLRPFVESCLQKDPYKRPTADTLLKQHKALWSKCKDGKYLVQALRIKDFPLDIEKESQSTSMMSDKEKPEKKSISLTKIQWQFELEEDEGF